MCVPLHRHGAILTSTALFVAVATLACKFHAAKTKRSHGQKSRGKDHSQQRRGRPDWPPHLQREWYKEERRQVMRPLITMKKPMYDNIMMVSQEGVDLATVSHKKAKWYVQKGLATWIHDNNSSNNSSSSLQNDRRLDPRMDSSHLRIQLLFEHSSARSTKDAALHTYNCSVKENCCVVCGATRDYMRHYIVPYCYRTLFPDHYKTHMPHDVVLLCPRCHVEAEGRTHRRMYTLEDTLRTSLQFRTRLHPTSAQAELVDKHIYNVRSAAMALRQWKDRLPLTKLTLYETRVREWHVARQDQSSAQLDLTNDVLIEASQLESRRPNPDYVPGADLVVESLQRPMSNGPREFDETKLALFIREWRLHFLDGLHPRHLPDGWSVDAAVHSQRHHAVTHV